MRAETHGGFPALPRSFDIRRKFGETRLCTVAPISTNLIRSYIAEHVSGLPRSYQLASMTLPLSGLLVVSLEQAVAAPMCSCRLADAGARVIKIERPEGDFARYYDGFAHGECSYFVWLNRGKESVVLDLTKDDDKALLPPCSSAPTYSCRTSNRDPRETRVPNLAIAARSSRPDLLLDFRLRRDGPYAKRKAYDFLIQAEAGLASITGTTEPSRVGVSVVDISTGLNAYEAILEALMARREPAKAPNCRCPCSIPSPIGWRCRCCNQGGKPPQRIGLTHPAISPYGAFPTRDGVQILIGVQNDREWRVLAEGGLDDPELAADPDFATNRARVKRRAETDGRVAANSARWTPIC